MTTDTDTDTDAEDDDAAELDDAPEDDGTTPDHDGCAADLFYLVWCVRHRRGPYPHVDTPAALAAAALAIVRDYGGDGTPAQAYAAALDEYHARRWRRANMRAHARRG